jgi:hypothetical protein
VPGLFAWHFFFASDRFQKKTAQTRRRKALFYTGKNFKNLILQRTKNTL